MTFSLVLLAALAQPAPEPAASSGLPPQQALAVVAGDGTLKITQLASGGFGPAVQETAVDVTEKKGTERVAAKATVKTTTVTLTTFELPAKYVEAYTVEGTPIPADKLAEMLAKERTVLVAMDGKKVDPFHLQLYKEGTIVLVPPPDAMGQNANPFFTLPSNGPPPPIPPPMPFYVQPPLPNLPPLPPNPFPDKKP